MSGTGFELLRPAFELAIRELDHELKDVLLSKAGGAANEKIAARFGIDPREVDERVRVARRRVAREMGYGDDEAPSQLHGVLLDEVLRCMARDAAKGAVEEPRWVRRFGAWMAAVVRGKLSLDPVPVPGLVGAFSVLAVVAIWFTVLHDEPEEVLPVPEEVLLVEADAGQGVAGESGSKKEADCSKSITDEQALRSLFEHTNGGDWTENEHWNTNAPLGEWHGVSTDKSCRVIALKLPYNKLSGSVPASLVNSLTHLQSLDLSGNLLSGPIPELSGLV